MQISVAGRQVQVGTQLKTRVTERLEAVVHKYFNDAMETHTVFTAEGKDICYGIQMHVGSGIDSRCEAS